MFLNDALEVFGRAGVIPDGIGVNNGDGTAGADAEAVGSAAMNESLWAAEFEIFEAFFEKLPGGCAFIEGAAFGLGGSRAKEDMALISVEIERFGSRCEEVRHGRGVGRKMLIIYNVVVDQARREVESPFDFGIRGGRRIGLFLCDEFCHKLSLAK